MSNDKKAADLEAELAAANKRIAQLEAAQAPAAGGHSPKDKAKIAKMKAEAKTEDGHKLYRIGPVRHYREGRMYEPGEVVRIPVDQDPSVTFEAVTDEAPSKAAPAHVVVAPKSSAGRASDKEL